LLKLEGESGESEEAQETNEESGEQPPDNDQTTQDATSTDQEAQEGDKEGIAVVTQCRQKTLWWTSSMLYIGLGFPSYFFVFFVVLL